jgi:hypothetical protein
VQRYLLFFVKTSIYNTNRIFLTNFRETPKTNRGFTDMKQIIRLTEEDIHRIVKESVEKILNEYGTPEQLGAIAARRTISGKDNAEEVHAYANKNGADRKGYYKGYINYLNNHQEEVNKYAKSKFNKRKKGTT